MKQHDLFQNFKEPDLFPEEAAPLVFRADPGKVRETAAHFR
jgi:hypothetical protein